MSVVKIVKGSGITKEEYSKFIKWQEEAVQFEQDIKLVYPKFLKDISARKQMYNWFENNPCPI